MTRLGLILVCEHYPNVSADADAIDAQLRNWLEESGTSFDAIDVYAAYAGDLPRHAGACDAYILSGMVLETGLDAHNADWQLRQFLRAAASLNRTIFAINCGEHVVHRALAACNAPAPHTRSVLRSIRNPFRSFHGRDTLHRFDPRSRRVEALTREPAICTKRVLARLQHAI